MRNNYRGTYVVIVGLGVTGLSCVNFFLNQGVVPKVIDTRAYPPQSNKLPYFIKSCFGKLHETWILNADLIIVSPGVRLDHPVLIEAKRLGIEIIGDIELFVREVTVPIIAITGSNGKSTVTRLVGMMAQYAGIKVGVVGNIGVPALTLLSKEYELYVLEISSFQLDTTYSLCASVATILNITEDHMDRYPDGLMQYVLSKNKIYHNAITCVINDSDSLTIPLSADCCGKRVSFGVSSGSADYRLEWHRGSMWMVIYNEYLLDCSELRILNHINYLNMLSALALSDSAKIPRMASFTALYHFFGLSHRFQLIYKNRTVSWINDSKSTNVESSKVAICNAIHMTTGRLHLLVGGAIKLADYFQLKNLIKMYEIHLYCFGQAGMYLTEFGYKNIILTNTMVESIVIVSRRVQKKDIVLLSPACSSLDQFRSFEMRGNVFTYFARKFG